MLKELDKKKQGFTIIEVVIVLVIGAIIMLMVFLVVPYLQRTQRDSRRQNDARRLLTALEQYSSNNTGQFPAALDGTLYGSGSSYITETFQDPTGKVYTVTYINNTDPGDVVATTDNRIIVATGKATCDTTTQGHIKNGQGNAISVYQENGGAVCFH